MTKDSSVEKNLVVLTNATAIQYCWNILSFFCNTRLPETHDWDARSIKTVAVTYSKRMLDEGHFFFLFFLSFFFLHKTFSRRRRWFSFLFFSYLKNKLNKKEKKHETTYWITTKSTLWVTCCTHCW